MIRAVRDAYREAFSGLPRAVWLLAFVTFVNRSGTMVLPFLALYLAEKKGFSVTGAGAILSLYGIGAMAGAYLGGWLSDMLNPRRVLEWSLALTGVGFLVLGSIDSHAGIAVMVIALSVVGEAFRPATAASLAESVARGESVRALALNRLAVNLGMTFGPAAGGFLAVHDYAWLFIVDGGTCLLAAVFLRVAFRGERRAAREADAAVEESARSPWRDGAILALALMTTAFAIAIFQIFGTYPLFLHGIYGFSEPAIGILLSINTIGIVVLQMPVVHATRAHRPLRVAGLGAFLFCAGLALMPLGSSYLFIACTVLVWTAGEMLSLPIIEGFVADRADERNRGRYMAVLSLSFSLAFIVAPVAGTWTYQRVGPDAVWYSCGAVGLLLWAALGALSRRVGYEDGGPRSG